MYASRTDGARPPTYTIARVLWVAQEGANILIGREKSHIGGSLE